MAAHDPRSRTQSPIVTGTSVVAVKYADGVMVVADTLGSYGSMAMFTSINRLKEVNSSMFIGCSGDLSDYQFLSDQLNELSINDFNNDDGHQLSPSEIYNFIHRFLYQRRSKMDPLWNSIIVAGYDKIKNDSFLGYINLNGTHYTDNFITTGYGQYLALPLLRKGWKPNMTEKEAKNLLESALRVLFYRDCRTINKFSIGKVTKEGVVFNWETKGNYYSIDTYWSYKRFENPNLSKEKDEKKQIDSTAEESKMDTK